GRDDLRARLENNKVAGAKKLAETISSAPGLMQKGALALQELANRGASVIPPSVVPERLRTDVQDPPLWLFVEGNPSVLTSHPIIAVVGTRAATTEGMRATSIVCQVLSTYPIVMVSGLAEGIDEEAHRITLAERVPNVAFLGHGLNTVFPQQT